MFEEYIPRLKKSGCAGRSAQIADIARRHGCSKDTVYRRLKQAGWSSGRKRRSDALKTSAGDDKLYILAALLKTGIRKNGKTVTSIPTARSVLEASGIHFNLSDARLAALLKERGIDLKSQKAPPSHVRMRSLHPNHVHQADPSLCLLYYLPRGGQKIIEENEAYKNKPFLEGKTHLKIWRYVLTDHYSGSVCVRYYQRAGESMNTLWDFLLYAWGPKEDEQYLFHGVPRILVMDKGSANLGGGIVNALTALGVEQYAHAVGVPRAKGQVESGNRMVECLFESRLKTDPVKGVDELNSRVQWWCAAYNANSLTYYDSTLGRAGKSRLELWGGIKREQLRELPEEARGLLASKPQSRKVAGDLTVSFVHPRLKESRFYRVGGLEGIRAGMEVQVQPLLMDARGGARVIWSYQGEEYSEQVNPIQVDEAGFFLDSPVFGQSCKANPDTYVEKAAKRLDELIGDAKNPFAAWNEGRGLGAVQNMSREELETSYFPYKGERVNAGQAPETVINTIEAAGRLKTRLGCWNPRFLEILQVNFPGGVPEGMLDELETILRAEGGEDELKAGAG